MGNTLTYFGTDPKMLGLATIGGLLTLFLIVWQILRFFYRKREILTRGIRSYRRRAILRDIREFKMSVKDREAGRSELYIAKYELRRLSICLYSFLAESLMAAMNSFFYFSNGMNWVNRTGAGAMFLLAILDAFGIRRWVLRAWTVIDWAYFPEKGKQALLQRAVRLRK